MPFLEIYLWFNAISMVGNLRSSVAHRAKQKYWRKWHSSTIFDSFLFCCCDYLLWIKQMDATRERFPTANNFYMIAPEFINYCRDANTLDLPINSLSISKRIFSYLISELELRPLLFFLFPKRIWIMSHGPINGEKRCGKSSRCSVD